MNLGDLHDRLGRDPFATDLGIRPDHLGDGECRLVLPYHERQDGLGALHGGATAALAGMTAQALARDGERDAASLVSLHVGYLRAGRGSASFTSTARTLRRAREFGFFDVRVGGEQGDVAHASATVSRHRDGAAPAPAAPELTGDPVPLDTAMATIPFLARRRITVTGAGRGLVRCELPAAGHNLDESGAVHEGALLALVDAAGATCPWTTVAIEPGVRGATVALHAQVLGPLPRTGLVARAEIRARDERVHWCDVTVLDAAERWVHALGHVVYRFAGLPRSLTVN